MISKMIVIVLSAYLGFTLGCGVGAQIFFVLWLIFRDRK